jgi:general secretion pathway protein D
VPDVPGKILQVVPLRYGVNVSIDRTILGLIDVQIQSDATQSALFVTGDREAILRALDVVGLLDQPATRARQVALISLTYIGSKQLTDELVTLLENEGIPTGVGRGDGKNVALVSLDQLGSIAVFASSEDLLARVQYWVRQIDRPSQGPEQRYFIYHPRYARAADLGQSLAPLVGAAVPQLGNQSRDTRSAMGGSLNDPEQAARSGSNGPGTGGISQQNAQRRDRASSFTGSEPMSVQGEGLTLSMDPRSNTLIFYTTGQRYQSLLPMIQRLDVAPKQILLEATIAEVTLTGEFSRGVEFAASRGEFSGGTEGNLGLPDGGLTLNWVGNVTDRVRAKLVASNSLVNILSNPTLVVRDGVEAAIKVGNDVPTVGASASDPIQSNRVITTVLYRRTGLELRIRPTINAQGLVVMEIDQSISNTVKGGSDVAGAPLFFERAVTTEVVARSGQSVLLAGLVSQSKNESRSKVPGIAEIPLLGWFFESKTSSTEKTELVVLITPRVINSPDDWDTIRPALQGAMEQLKLP